MRSRAPCLPCTHAPDAHTHHTHTHTHTRRAENPEARPEDIVKAEQKVRVRIDNIDKDKIRLSMMEKFDVRYHPHTRATHCAAQRSAGCCPAVLASSVCVCARSCVHVCVCALLLPGNML